MQQFRNSWNIQKRAKIKYSSHQFKRNNLTIKKSICPVSWGCRIHQLHLCRGVRQSIPLSHWWHPEKLLLWLECPSDDWLNDHSLCGYLCIYNFTVSTHSFQFVIYWSWLIPMYYLSSSNHFVYTAGTFCFRNS